MKMSILRSANRRHGDAAVANLYDRVDSLQAAAKVGFIWKAIPLVITIAMLLYFSAQMLYVGGDPMFSLTLFVASVLVFVVMYLFWKNDLLRQSIVAMF